MVKEALVAERERLFGLLQQVPVLSPFPSQANFILCAVKDGMAEKIKVRFHSLLSFSLDREAKGTELKCRHVNVSCMS